MSAEVVFSKKDLELFDKMTVVYASIHGGILLGKEIEKIRAMYTAEVTALVKRHEARIAELEASHAKEMGALSRKLDVIKTRIGALQEECEEILGEGEKTAE